MTALEVIDDLEAEQDQLEAMLSKLSPADWTSPSAAAGWTVADVMLHLAQTEEAVAAALGASGGLPEVRWAEYGTNTARTWTTR